MTASQVKKSPINSKVLRWAREQANYTLQEAATKAKINELKRAGIAPWERIERWESGADKPTVSQLKQLARAYRRPLLTFFLPKPPRRESRLSDFRTIGDKPLPDRGDSPEFAALARNIEVLYKRIRDLIEEEGGKPLAFVGSATHNHSPIQIAQSIRDILGFPIEEQKSIPNSGKFLAVMRNKAENSGFFIILQGNLGSWHTKIPPKVFRGLAVSDPIAPFIVINKNDYKVAQVFTFVHEMTHILLGETGISNSSAFDSRSETPLQNELLCNQVAAEFLVPETFLRREWPRESTQNPAPDIERIARQFKVSDIVVARRLFDLGFIENDFYWKFYNKCMARLRKQKEAKTTQEDAREIKIPIKIRTQNRLGKKLINVVIGAAQNGIISELDASKILNVKINHFNEIQSTVV